MLRCISWLFALDVCADVHDRGSPRLSQQLRECGKITKHIYQLPPSQVELKSKCPIIPPGKPRILTSIPHSADFPSFAFSIDLGTISATKSPVVWALGLTRDPAVGYTINGTIQNRSPYWASSFNDASDAVSAHSTRYYVQPRLIAQSILR